MLRLIVVEVNLRRTNSTSLQKCFGVTNGDGEVGAAETTDDSIVHANDLALRVEKRPAGAPRRRLRIVGDLVAQDVADVALRRKRTNQAAACKLGHDLAGSFTR